MEEPEAIDEKSELIAAVQKAAVEWNGEQLPLEATYALSDSRHFRRSGIPAINFCGPGGPDKGIQGHCVDEYVEIEQLMHATKVMVRILESLMA
jgi:acetylornithine deacetylase/succinyl-diaminopimelate desuccinylase-like protein